MSSIPASLRPKAMALFLATTGALAASVPTPAHAQSANNFGEKHQLIVSADRLLPLLSFSSESLTATQGGNTTTTTDTGTSIAFLIGREPNLAVVHTLPRVAFDFVVVRHFTLGGAFAFGVGIGGKHEEDGGNNTIRTTDTPNNTIIGFAPRAGYVIPFASTLAFWPRLGFAFYSVSETSHGTGNNNVDITTTNKDTILSLDLDPQLAWVPVEHFFIHVGPILNIPISGSRSVETETGSNSQTVKNDLSVFHIGLSAGLGGWFDL
jgi:hypothetical protein